MDRHTVRKIDFIRIPIEGFEVFEGGAKSNDPTGIEATYLREPSLDIEQENFSTLAERLRRHETIWVEERGIGIFAAIRIGLIFRPGKSQGEAAIRLEPDPRPGEARTRYRRSEQNPHDFVYVEIDLGEIPEKCGRDPTARNTPIRNIIKVKASTIGGEHRDELVEESDDLEANPGWPLHEDALWAVQFEVRPFE